MISKKSLFLIISLLILGFFYRLFLSSFAFKEPVYDMFTYVDTAKNISRGIFLPDCCNKNLGYPFFLAGVGYFFGLDNLFAVRIVQIIIDLLVAVLLFLLGRRIFNEKAAWISFVLYILNPFTSSYIGLRLPEVSSLFYVSLVGLILSGKKYLKSVFSWFSLGLFLGLLLFTKMSFYYFIFIFIILSAILFFRGIKRYIYCGVVLLGFLITSFYTLFTNYSTYGKLSFVPLYSRTPVHLYTNFKTFRYPELLSDYSYIDPEYKAAMWEYYSVGNNVVLIKQLNEKYNKLLRERLKTDWPVFMLNLGKNMFWLWDKYHLYTYTDPFYPMDLYPLRIFNIINIVLFTLGLIFYIKKEKRKIIENPLFVFTVLLFFYMTFAFSLVSTESRHTIAFYSLLSLWAGFGIERLFNLYCRKRSNM